MQAQSRRSRCCDDHGLILHVDVKSNDFKCILYSTEIPTKHECFKCAFSSDVLTTKMADKKEKNNDCTQDSVIEIGLQAAVGQRKSKGHKSSVSVLDPAIFISRSCKRFDPFKKKKETEPSDAQTSDEHDTEYLHFRVSFTLEIEIVNFEHAYVRRDTVDACVGTC